MINERPLTITFTYKGVVETRKIWWMHIDVYDIKEFYRIKGKKNNFDIYKFKKDGVWCNKLEPGLSDEVLALVGEAIDRAESN